MLQLYFSFTYKYKNIDLVDNLQGVLDVWLFFHLLKQSILKLAKNWFQIEIKHLVKSLKYIRPDRYGEQKKVLSYSSISENSTKLYCYDSKFSKWIKVIIIQRRIF